MQNTNDQIHSRNLEISQQINLLTKQINILKDEYDKNKLELQKQCKHKFEREIVYGERTKNICIYCDYTY